VCVFKIWVVFAMQGIILNGMRITLFTLWGTQLEHRLFECCSKCLLIRLVKIVLCKLRRSTACIKLKMISNLSSYFLQAFKGHEHTSENSVLSITSLSGAFNGTTRTYLDGMQ
jgi:hypothetical protein